MPKQAKPAKTRRLPMTAGNMLASLEKRKTVTRRSLRPQPGRDNRIPYPGKPRLVINVGDPKLCELSPYGKPGDPIVLTESWKPRARTKDIVDIEYRADGAREFRRMPDDGARRKINRALAHGNWMPPMFQQVWASRAPAVVKSIRVERVQEISIDDAFAEGVESLMGYARGDGPWNDPAAIETFRELWQSINGDRPGCAWADDPVVWCVEYELSV